MRTVHPARIELTAELPPARPEGTAIRTADLLGAFSLASDLAMGLTMEHGACSCYIGMHIAHEMELPLEQRTDLYYAELLKGAGCTTYTSQLASSWLVDELAAKRALQDLPQLNIYRRFSNVFRMSNCAQLSMGLGPVSSHYYPYYPRSNSPRGTLSGAEVWAGSPTQ